MCTHQLVLLTNHQRMEGGDLPRSAQTTPRRERHHQGRVSGGGPAPNNRVPGQQDQQPQAEQRQTEFGVQIEPDQRCCHRQ